MVAVHAGYAERRGGDAWLSRGANQSLVRAYTTPRRSLFTPCRAPRGPAHPDELADYRCTSGVDINGQMFKIVDNWRDVDESHRVLELPWTPATKFMSAEQMSLILKPSLE